LSYTITITAETADEAMAKIRLLAGLMEAEQERQAATVPEPQADVVPEPQTEEQPPRSDAPPATLEEVRARLSELMQAGKHAEVRGLFGTVHSGATKLSEVPKEKFGQLLQAAEALS
jgi:alkanesulfonate monooxygenase SsuD/methylene tetrahydromethanopterin reductase-like flavin-dependent oxidoreductase (luciferase family)